MVNTVADALAKAKSQIERFDAEYLLATLLNVSRASLIAHTERTLSEAEAIQFDMQVAARALGVPVAQIIGRREFYGRDFAVTADVLIPRPETEILITQALACISSQKWLKAPANISVCQICDLGTGSGAIAITLALEALQMHATAVHATAAHVTAVDQSLAALKLAVENAESLHANITAIQSDWYSALTDKKFHLIVANPPYIAKDDPHLSRGDLRFEPHMALTDDSVDGLASIRTIIAGAPAHLHDGGTLMIEHGYDQAPRCRALFIEAGFVEVESINDLAGIARVTQGRINTNEASSEAL
jgi:release factor glutamine methyltransferase